MYREAEKQINAGLSLTARVLLGGIAGLFGLMMVVIAPPTDKQIFFYLFSGFCFAICFACVFRGRVRHFMGSLIGVVLAFLSGWYVFEEIVRGGTLFSARSGQSIFNALMFTAFFGIPGISYAVKVKFGFGKKNENVN